MKGKLLLVLCLLLLLSCLLYSRFSQTVTKALSGSPVHNLNTGLNYTTIQDAINANETLDGHTILVDAGVYNESLLINKSISLKGENKDDTILNATFQITPLFDLEAAMVNITASNVEIAGFNLTGWYFNQISASSCSNIAIRDNIVTSGGTCIALSNANNCTVADNIIVGDGLEGNNLVVLTTCSGCIIRNNTIEYACYEGIRLVGSNNNLIYENLISDNQYGIDFYNGLDTGNTIFHNNFEGNYYQIIGGGGNYFNESFEGNYWSDYEGKDVNQDGIGDTPYANLDFYPLVGAFQDFTVLSPTDGLKSITIISNSTVTDLNLDYYVPTNDSVQSDEPFIKFSVTGQNGTIGFCRLMIPNAIMNSSSYIVFVNNKPVNVKQLLISNSTVAYLYFTYSQSTRQVLVFVPEFPSFLILPLFFIITLFSAMIYKKRR